MTVATLSGRRLAECAPELERLLTRGIETTPLFGVSEIRCDTVSVAMRDGVRLATDVYLPPKRPAPAIAMRTPYGRASDKAVGVFLAFARRGYIVISQDCRGTGESEPDTWNYYMHEAEDGYDLVEWITTQSWFDGFLGGCGGSYVGQTQWCMATHPRMSTIVPEVSGLGIATNTAHLYMFVNAYARSVGKGDGKVSVHYTELERLMPELLEPGRIYRFEIDMWATANRFRADHRLRLDISSADFPRFDRNTNRGGEPGPPVPAVQTIYHDPEYPSHLLVPVLGSHCIPG